jgi:hypothetical protein
MEEDKDARILLARFLEWIRGGAVEAPKFPRNLSTTSVFPPQVWLRMVSELQKRLKTPLVCPDEKINQYVTAWNEMCRHRNEMLCWAKEVAKYLEDPFQYGWQPNGATVPHYKVISFADLLRDRDMVLKHLASEVVGRMGGESKITGMSSGSISALCYSIKAARTSQPLHWDPSMSRKLIAAVFEFLKKPKFPRVPDELSCFSPQSIKDFLPADSKEEDGKKKFLEMAFHGAIFDHLKHPRKLLLALMPKIDDPGENTEVKFTFSYIGGGVGSLAFTLTDPDGGEKTIKYGEIHHRLTNECDNWGSDRVVSHLIATYAIDHFGPVWLKAWEKEKKLYEDMKYDCGDLSEIMKAFSKVQEDMSKQDEDDLVSMLVGKGDVKWITRICQSMPIIKKWRRNLGWPDDSAFVEEIFTQVMAQAVMEKTAYDSMKEVMTKCGLSLRDILSFTYDVQHNKSETRRTELVAMFVEKKNPALIKKIQRHIKTIDRWKGDFGWPRDFVFNQEEFEKLLGDALDRLA